MLIQQKYLDALLSGEKSREGRAGASGGVISRVRPGKTVFFQNWSKMAWWRVTSVDAHCCASDMLKAHGFRAFVPWAVNSLDALLVYFLLDKANKGKGEGNITVQDVQDWDCATRLNPDVQFYAWAGHFIKIQFPVFTRIHTAAHTRTHMHAHTRHTHTTHDTRTCVFDCQLCTCAFDCQLCPHTHTHSHTLTHTCTETTGTREIFDGCSGQTKAGEDVQDQLESGVR